MAAVATNKPAETGTRTTDARIAQTRRVIRRGLGALWILDGLLQLQPAMFSMAMLHNLMQPLAQGQPVWVSGLINWAVAVMTPHVPLWNLGIVAIQILIGVLLLSERHESWMRAGLMVSVVWSAVVWLFGEGLGGILTGSASVLSGAPGSVLLYAWLAVLLLLDDRAWAFGAGFNWVRDGVAIFWALAALQQLVPVFWSPIGLSSQFQSNLMMQPHAFAATIAWIVSLSYSHAVWINLALVLAMAYLAWGLYGAHPQPSAYALAALLLALIWWLGQGFGDIFTGMATDLNTVPLIGLMMVPGWMARHTVQAPRKPAGGTGRSEPETRPSLVS